MNRATKQSTSVTSLIIPAAWGGAVYLLLAAILDGKIIEHELAVRYLTGHPISRVTTLLFCIGMISLIGTWWRVLRQSRQLPLLTLTTADEADSTDDGGADRAIATRLLEELNDKPSNLHDNEAWQRLHHLLWFVQRSGSATQLDQELKHASDLALERQQQQLSFVKILIWATPMLGFLGTVIGISQALGGLNVGADQNLQAMMGNLQSNLYVAFDTTALALLLSMVMMFGMFFVERVEQSFLREVDEQTLEQLTRCFPGEATSDHVADNHVRRVGQKLLAAARAAIKEQTRLWQQSMQSVDDAWSSTQARFATETGSQISTAVAEVMQRFVQTAESIAEQTEARIGTRLEQWQTQLTKVSQTISHQQELSKTQCDLLASLLKQLEMSYQEQLATHRELLQSSQQGWRDLADEQTRQQEVQHHRFQHELNLFREMIQRLDVAQKAFQDSHARAFETHHAEEHRLLRDNLVELVEIMQLMKDELVQTQETRAEQSNQQFRLQIAPGTRKAG